LRSNIKEGEEIYNEYRNEKYMESLMRIYKEDIENIEMDIELYERIKNENER